MDRLLVPTDSNGRKCGIDNGVVNKPYLVFFNLEKCIDPTVPIYGCQTPQVCVEQCPSTSFIYDEYKCNDGKIPELRNQLICKLEVDKERQIQSCADISRLIQKEDCARWYLQSNSCKFFFFLLNRSFILYRSVFSFCYCSVHIFICLNVCRNVFCNVFVLLKKKLSVLKRCISGLPKTECPYIPKRYLQQMRSRHSRSILPAQDGHMLTKRSPFQFPDGLGPSSQLADEPVVQCEERRLLGTQILIEKGQHFDSMLSRFVGNFIILFSNQTTSQEVSVPKWLQKEEIVRI